MQAIKRIQYQGHTATLFADGSIVWAGMWFENGKAANAGLLAAINRGE